MTQSVLLDKFSIYLELKKTEIGSQYDPQLIDNLIKDFNDHGFCFGFALSYAIMNYLEKLALWRAMLVAAYSWNGKPNTLKSNYELPGRKKLALNDIFEELIQAVTFYQTGNPVHSFLNEEAFWSEFDYRLAHSVPSIDFNSFSQRNILGVGVHFLEIDNGVGQLKHIQADARIEDQFSLEALTDTLDEEVIKGCICLVFSEKHAISVIYNEPFWQVYDANYSHASAVKLAKFFSNKEEVAKEIISILGNELTIKLASLDQKIEIKLKEWTESFETFKQEVYQDLLAIKNNDLSYFISRLQVHKDILDLTALEVFIFYFPNRLENRLETFYWFAKKNEKTADPVLDLVCFSQCSFKFFDFMLQRPNIFCALLDIYKKLNGFNEFLVYVQRKYPKELTSFLHSIKESTAKNFSSQILLHNLEDMTLLQWSGFFDKRNFSAILAIIANTPEGDIWLASQLARRKPETGKVGLQIFWETSGKQHLPAFLAIIEKSNNEGAVAYLVLALKNNIKRNSQSVLEYLCSDKGFSENHLKLILKIISQSESQSTIFFKWLTSPNQESWMPLQSLFDKDPKHLIPFLEEAKKNSNIANYIVPALGRPSPSGWTISSIIKDPYCLSLAGQALEEISKLLSVLVKNKEKVRNSSYSPFWQTSLLTSRKCDGKTRYIDLSENWTLTPELKI